MSDTMQEQVEGISMQDYFDKTIRHLVSQGQQAADEVAYVCAYLTDTGLKCAIGIHIPDGHEAQVFTGALDVLCMIYPDLAGTAWIDTLHGYQLAEALQSLHDDPKNWDYGFFGWVEAQRIADRFGLDTSFMGTLKEKQDD